MNVLLVLNDPPYGSERSYNGLRLAMSLSKRDDVEVRVFLLGDAVTCAVAGQKLPNGFYNLERMLGAVAHRGGEIGCCGSCLEARGLTGPMLVAEAHRSSMDELTDWTLEADQVLTF